jgi:hypothetical protein
MPSPNNAYQPAPALDSATVQLITIAELSQRWCCRYHVARDRLARSRVPVIALGPGTFRVRLSEVLKAESSIRPLDLRHA